MDYWEMDCEVKKLPDIMNPGNPEIIFKIQVKNPGNPEII